MKTYTYNGYNQNGYILKVDKDKWSELKWKFSTSIKGGKVKLPSAFTEKGLYMLATILKSKRATQTTIAIIETFAKIRQLSKTIKELSLIKDDKQKQNLLQKSGEIFTDIFEDSLQTTGSETTIEINFAVLKFKHTIKKKK